MGVTLVVLAVVTAVVLALVFRGRPSTFGRPVVHRSGLLGIAVVGLATSPLAKSTGVYSGWLIVAAIAAGWFLAVNRGRPGLGLAIGGLALNALVIIINSGMPVSLAAADRAGVPLSRVPLDTDPLREELTTETTLSWLGEAVPLAIPLRPAVVSPGDVLLAAGGALFVFTGLTGFGRTVPERELTPTERKAQRKARKARVAAETQAASVDSSPQTTSVLGRRSDEDTREAAATGTQPEDVEPEVERATSEVPASGNMISVMPTRELPEAPSAAPDAPASVGSSDNGAGPPAVDDPAAAAAAAAAAERSRLKKIRRQQKRKRKQQIAAHLAQIAPVQNGDARDGDTETRDAPDTQTGDAPTGDTQNGDTEDRDTENRDTEDRDTEDRGATLPAARSNEQPG